MVNAIVRVEAM